MLSRRTEFSALFLPLPRAKNDRRTTCFFLLGFFLLLQESRESSSVDTFMQLFFGVPVPPNSITRSMKDEYSLKSTVPLFCEEVVVSQARPGT